MLSPWTLNSASKIISDSLLCVLVSTCIQSPAWSHVLRKTHSSHAAETEGINMCTVRNVLFKSFRRRGVRSRVNDRKNSRLTGMRVLRERAVWGGSDRTMSAQGAVAMRAKVEQTKGMEAGAELEVAGV